MAFLMVFLFLGMGIGSVFYVLEVSNRRWKSELDEGEIPMDILAGLKVGKQWFEQEQPNTFATKDGWTIAMTNNLHKLTFRDPVDQSLTVCTRLKRNQPDSKVLHDIFLNAVNQVALRRQIAEDQAKSRAEAEKVKEVQMRAERFERMRSTLVEKVQDGELSITSNAGGELSMPHQSGDDKQATKPNP